MQNKIKSFFAIALLFVLQISFGQLSSKRTTIIAGLEPGTGFSIVSKRAVGTIPRFWILRFAPYASFKINKNIYLGINYEYQFGKIERNSFPTQNGLGIHSRFFLPFGNTNFLTKNRFKFYTSFEWLKLDHYLDPNSDYGFSKLNGLKNNNFNLLVGSNIRILNSWYLNLAIRPMFFSKGHSFLFSQKGAIEYHFSERRLPYIKQQPKRFEHNTKKKRPFDLSHIFNKTTLGGSYTFIWDNNNTDQKFYYKESTINLNISTSITSDIDFGIAVLPIWTKSLSKSPERFLLLGVFTQYDFLRLESGKSRLFAETGFYKGNLCTCGNDVPFYRPNLNYLPIGGGYEIKIAKNRPLFLDLSFQWFNILNRLPFDKWAYSQYVIGLNYQIFNK